MDKKQSDLETIIEILQQTNIKDMQERAEYYIDSAKDKAKVDEIIVELTRDHQLGQFAFTALAHMYIDMGYDPVTIPKLSEDTEFLTRFYLLAIWFIEYKAVLYKRWGVEE